MITRDQIIVIGHFNKTHGVNGEINASLLVDDEVLRHLTCIVADMDGIFVPFFVSAVRLKGASAVLLTIEDIDDEQQASALVGKDVFALKIDYDRLAEQMRDDDDEQLPLDYFIGFQMTDNGVHVGHIEAVDESTDNVLFVVSRDDDTKVYVPAVDDLIVEMDLEKRSIDMNLPDGLLDI